MYPTLLLGTALAVAAPGLKDRPKSDPLVGVWQQESIGLDGKVAPELGDRRWEFTADGKHMRYRGAEKVWAEGVPYVVDPKAEPKALDMGRALAVYKVEGDTLTVCVAQNELKTRPTSFDMLKNSNTALYVFKRLKPKD